MIELAQLFQDVEAAVIQHEPAVEEIEQKAEATHENVGKATVEIDGAISKARSRRKKQWWCLGIGRTFCLFYPPPLDSRANLISLSIFSFSLY